MTSLISRSADFFIRMTMMLTIALVLIYFGVVYEQVALTILFFLYVIAIIIKGVADIAASSSNNRNTTARNESYY